MAERKSHSNYEQIMATIKHEHVSFVNLEFTDVVGIVKCVTFLQHNFQTVLNKVNGLMVPPLRDLHE